MNCFTKGLGLRQKHLLEELCVFLKHYRCYALILALIVVPLISKLVPRPGIASIIIHGKFDTRDTYLCLFTDNDLKYSLENADKGTFINDSSEIIFSKPVRISKPVHFYRLDFGPILSDSIIIKKIDIRYDDGKLKSFKAKECFEKTDFKWGIKNILYNDKGEAIIYFDKGYLYNNHYIEFNAEKRSYNISNFFIYIGLLFFLWFVLDDLKLRKKDLPLFLISSVGFISFFSSILINNIFIISICIMSLILFFKEHYIKKPKSSFYFLIILFVIKLTWTIIPENSHTLSIVFEKYMTLLLLPFAFLFIRLTQRFVILSYKSVLLITLVLLYINYCSFINYLSLPGLLNVDSSYISPVLFHSPSFKHSSYVVYFYSFGLLSALEIYKKKEIHFIYPILLCFLITLFSIAASAYVGLIFMFLFIIYFLFSLLMHNSTRLILTALGIICFLFATLFPLTHYIEKLDPIREVTWDLAKEGIADNWLLGLGTGGEQKIYNPQYVDQNPLYVVNIPLNNTHNQLLNAIVEHGVFFGSYIYIFMCFLMFISCKEGNYLLYLFILISLIFMTTEVIFDRSRGLIFFILVISFLEQSFSKVDIKGSNGINT